MKVYYDTEEQRYFLLEDGKRRPLTSVSSLIKAHSFSMSQEMRIKAAEKHAKKRKTTAEAILEEWDTQYNSAVDYGNALHNAEAGGSATILSVVKQPGIVEYEYKRVRELPDGEYRELRIFDDKYFISARIDYCKIWTDISGKRFVHIHDYKTGWIRDYRQSETTGAVYRMKAPLQRIADSEVGKVKVQLSIYGYLFAIEGIDPSLELWHDSVTRDSNTLDCIGPYMSETNNMYQRYKVPFLPEPIFFLLNQNKIKSYGAAKDTVPQGNPFAKSRS
jgi:hypothetical protein